MGQAHSSNKLLPGKPYEHGRSRINLHPHVSKIKTTEFVMPSPRKKQSDKLEHSMKMGSNFWRNLSAEGEKETKMWEDDVTQEFMMKMILKFLSPELKPGSETVKLESKIIPQLDQNYFQFGEHPADQEFVIYLRLDGCDELWNSLLQRYSRCGNKVEISISLKYHGDQFFERRLPLEFTPSLNVKFSVRCNEENFAEVLKNLASKILVFVGETEYFSKVSESEEIYFGPLVHTTASLGLCRISDVKGHPESDHYLGCYIFLDHVLVSQPYRKTAASFCTSCAEGSHLMTVFNEVKRSSGTVIDLCSSQEAVKPIEIDLTGTIRCEDDECVEPADLRFKPNTTIAVTTEKTEIALEDPPTVLDHGAVHSETVIEKVSNSVGSQTPGKSVQTATAVASKADAKLTGVIKPIKRKHKGRSRELYLMNKVKEMEKRLLELTKEHKLPENKLQRAISETDSGIEVSTVSRPPPPPTTTYLLVKNPDGSNAIVPAIPVNAVPSSSGSSEEKLYQCPEKGCTEGFNNKSSLSRHRKKVHFPNKLHKCDNCGHAFPRPYMLQRHLDHKVCLPKQDASKSSSTVLVVN